MAFESRWLNWRREPGQPATTMPGISVSSVSSLDTHICPKEGSKEEEEDTLKLHTSDKTRKVCIRSTDKTDKTPSSGQILDGHKVTTVVWETSAAVVFRDEAGHFWRYLHGFGKAWPVIVDGRQ